MSNNLNKSTGKFIMDMEYGIAKSNYINEIEDSFLEETTVIFDNQI
ncbi:MAG: hypothetical protein RR404_03650 [Bacilli bacterium]